MRRRYQFVVVDNVDWFLLFGNENSAEQAGTTLLYLALARGTPANLI